MMSSNLAPLRAVWRACYTDRDVMGTEAKHRYTTKCFERSDEMSVPLGYLLLMALLGVWAMAYGLSEPL